MKELLKDWCTKTCLTFVNLNAKILEFVLRQTILSNELNPNSNPVLDKIKMLEQALDRPYGTVYHGKEDFYTTHPAIQKMKDAVARRTRELQAHGSVGKIKRMTPQIPKLNPDQPPAELFVTKGNFPNAQTFMTQLNERLAKERADTLIDITNEIKKESIPELIELVEKTKKKLKLPSAKKNTRKPVQKKESKKPIKKVKKK